MDATVAVDASRYGKFTSEDFQNPSLRTEFTKQSGRTTGSLVLSAARSSQADSAANIRDESWTYQADLNLKYPVIERYSISGNVGYMQRNFVGNSSLVNLKSYSAGLDLYYVYTTERDLLAGYHFREDETSADTKTFDHSFTAGLSGRLLWQLHGAVRAGYVVHVSEGATNGTYGSWTANGNIGWNPTRRTAMTAQLSKDVSITSTDVSVDSTAVAVDGQYSYNSKTALVFGTGWSNSRFLGALGGGRRDQNWNWNVGVNRTLTNYLKATLNYTFAENWSTDSFADFVRRSVTLTLVTRF
jgi:hypothetical protein